jgi:hypothetical protein
VRGRLFINCIEGKICARISEEFELFAQVIYQFFEAAIGAKVTGNTAVAPVQHKHALSVVGYGLYFLIPL